MESNSQSPQADVPSRSGERDASCSCQFSTAPPNSRQPGQRNVIRTDLPSSGRWTEDQPLHSDDCLLAAASVRLTERTAPVQLSPGPGALGAVGLPHIFALVRTIMEGTRCGRSAKGPRSRPPWRTDCVWARRHFRRTLLDPPPWTSTVGCSAQLIPDHGKTEGETAEQGRVEREIAKVGYV